VTHIAVNTEILTVVTATYIAIYNLTRLTTSPIDELQAYMRAAFQTLNQTYATIHQICTKTHHELQQAQDNALRQKKTDKLKMDLIEPNAQVSHCIHRSLHGALSRLLAIGSPVQHLRDYLDELFTDVLKQKKADPLILDNSHRVIDGIKILGQKIDAYEAYLTDKATTDAQVLGKQIVKLKQWNKRAYTPIMGSFEGASCLLSLGNDDQEGK
jgi:hypothetical protein